MKCTTPTKDDIDRIHSPLGPHPPFTVNSHPFFSPVPSHAAHPTYPLPLHVEHDFVFSSPSKTLFSWPLPRQSSHVRLLYPKHASHFSGRVKYSSIAFVFIIIPETILPLSPPPLWCFPTKRGRREEEASFFFFFFFFFFFGWWSSFASRGEKVVARRKKSVVIVVVVAFY